MKISLQNCIRCAKTGIRRAALHTPTWYQLRSIGRSPIARMTILMPVIGYFILFGDFTSDLFSIVGDRLGLNQEEAVDFSVSSVYWIYFGLLLFSFSTILYNIFCPDLIKDFTNRYEFFTRESDVMTSGRVIAIVKELKDQFKMEIHLEFETDAGDDDTKFGKGAQQLEKMRSLAVKHSQDHFITKYSGPILDLLHKKYDLYDESQSGMRRIIFYTYIAATLIIAIPTLRTVWLILTSLGN